MMSLKNLSVTNEGIGIPEYWKELVTHHIETMIVTKFHAKEQCLSTDRKYEYAKIDHNFTMRKFIIINRIIYKYKQR